MRQVCILGEHTVSNFEATRIFQLMLHLECIEVALFLHYIERLYGVNVLFAVLRSIGSYQFQADCIVQSLLVITYVIDEKGLNDAIPSRQ